MKNIGTFLCILLVNLPLSGVNERKHTKRNPARGHTVGPLTTSYETTDGWNVVYYAQGRKQSASSYEAFNERGDGTPKVFHSLVSSRAAQHKSTQHNVPSGVSPSTRNQGQIAPARAAFATSYCPELQCWSFTNCLQHNARYILAQYVATKQKSQEVPFSQKISTRKTATYYKIQEYVLDTKVQNGAVPAILDLHAKEPTMTLHSMAAHTGQKTVSLTPTETTFFADQCKKNGSIRHLVLYAFQEASKIHIQIPMKDVHGRHVHDLVTITDEDFNS